MVGRRLGHYLVLRKLGSGGMGEVYLARDEHLQRDVAIKVLPAGALADDSARKRFHKEALALSQLNHPNIARVYDFDTEQGIDFMVMECIPGITLHEKLLQTRLSEREIARLGIHLAEGLRAAHEQGIIHRDLKPGNLIISTDGRLKILDFGLAKLLQPLDLKATADSLTETHGISGTLPYMAPEQLRAEAVDARTDIYAAGVVLFEMATTCLPFHAKHAVSLMDAILHEPPPPPDQMRPELSSRLNQVILKCLEKNPELRYQSAQDLRVDLERLLTAGSDVTSGRSEKRPNRRTRRIRALAVLPLENISKEQDYFADGMTEALTTVLAKITGLRVVSRTSVMRYKDSTLPLSEIARELNVDAVVEGSVMHVRDRVRITAQLIQVSTDEHLWAESYDRDVCDVLGLQNEIARAIAEEIKVKLTPKEKARLASSRAVNPETYQAYLKGLKFAREYFVTKSPEDHKKAIELFEFALQKDPEFEPAHAALARAYFEFFRDYGDAQNLVEAEYCARLLLGLNPNSAPGHGLLASVFLWSGHKDIAIKQAKKALKMDATEGAAYEALGLGYLMSGQLDAAAQQFNAWMQLDPAAPAPYRRLVDCHIWSGDYEGGHVLMDKALTLYPNSPVFRRHLARVYYHEGALAEAKKLLEESIELEPYRGFEARCLLALVLARSGALRAGTELLTREVLNYAKVDFVESTLYVAQFHALVGDLPAAMQWFERAVIRGNENCPWHSINPDLHPLRAEVRFQQLLSKLEARHRAAPEL